MNIVEIADQKKWQEFFNQAGSQTFLQSWEWGEFQQSLGNKIIRLGIYDNERLMSIVQVVIIKAKRGSFLFVPQGPVIIQNSELRIQNLIETARDYLINLAKKHGHFFIRIAPILQCNQKNQKLFKDLGFKTAPIYMHAERIWVLSLASEEKLLSEMRKTTRYLIKKAGREEVKIEKRSGERAVDDFYQIYEETARREKFTPFSKDYIKKEFEAFNKTGNAIFLFGQTTKKISEEYGFEKMSRVAANYRNTIKPTSLMHFGKDVFEPKGVKPYAASALILFTKSTAFYHQGASIHTKIPVTYLLQWEAIKEVIKRGCQYYNFWGIHLPGRTPKSWDGLTLFKTGFGGKAVDYLPTQDLIISPKYYLTYLYEKFLGWQRGV